MKFWPNVHTFGKKSETDLVRFQQEMENPTDFEHEIGLFRGIRCSWHYCFDPATFSIQEITFRSGLTTIFHENI